ncbi:MAG: hypothetical protein M3015_01350 [Bacteroidota bacterium]|nr:hypothetical protein [Bacteroidota bacterium]
MSNPAKQIEVFRDFAKNELENHLLELNTKYQNRKPAFDDLTKEAYSEHRQVLENELSEKIKELITEDNRFLRPSLEEIKEKYVDKLKPSLVL